MTYGIGTGAGETIGKPISRIIVDGDITEETIAEDKIKLIRWTLDSQKDLLLAAAAA